MRAADIKDVGVHQLFRERFLPCVQSATAWHRPCGEMLAYRDQHCVNV
jgi:hypothetical protein